jgi:hypothetical protein
VVEELDGLLADVVPDLAVVREVGVVTEVVVAAVDGDEISWWLQLVLARPRLTAAYGADAFDDISEAFWQACHGGQRRAAEYLLHHGANINHIPGYAKQTAVDIAIAPDTRRDLLHTWLCQQDARHAEKGG